MKVIFPFYIAIGLMLLFISCKEDEPTLSDMTQESIIAHLDTLVEVSDLNVSPGKDEFGIWSYPVTIAPPSAGDVMIIRYQLSVLGGSLLEKINAPDSIVVLRNALSVYPLGIDMALTGLNTGEVWQFFIPGELGLGTYSLDGLFEENAILDFRIEVLETLTLAEVGVLEDTVIQTYIRKNKLNEGTNPIKSLITGFGSWYQRTAPGTGLKLRTDDITGLSYRMESLTPRYNSNDSLVDVIGLANSVEIFVNNTALMIGLEAGINEMYRGEKGLMLIPSRAAYSGSVGLIPSFLGQQLGESLVSDGVIPAYALRVRPFETLIVTNLSVN